MFTKGSKISLEWTAEDIGEQSEPKYPNGELYPLKLFVQKPRKEKGNEKGKEQEEEPAEEGISLQGLVNRSGSLMKFGGANGFHKLP